MSTKTWKGYGQQSGSHHYSQVFIYLCITQSIVDVQLSIHGVLMHYPEMVDHEIPAMQKLLR